MCQSSLPFPDFYSLFLDTGEDFSALLRLDANSAQWAESGSYMNYFLFELLKCQCEIPQYWFCPVILTTTEICVEVESASSWAPKWQWISRASLLTCTGLVKQRETNFCYCEHLGSVACLFLQHNLASSDLYSVLITKAWHKPHSPLPAVKDCIPLNQILLSGEWALKTVSTFWQCSFWVLRPEKASFLANLLTGISGSFCPSTPRRSFASALDIANQEPIKLQVTKHLLLNCERKGGFPTASQYTFLLASNTQCRVFAHFLRQ